MCLKIQYGIYQWLCTFSFFNKSQNRCSLLYRILVHTMKKRMKVQKVAKFIRMRL